MRPQKTLLHPSSRNHPSPYQHLGHRTLRCPYIWLQHLHTTFVQHLHLQLLPFHSDRTKPYVHSVLVKTNQDDVAFWNVLRTMNATLHCQHNSHCRFSTIIIYLPSAYSRPCEVTPASKTLPSRDQRNLHDLCVTNFQSIDNRFNSMDTRFMTLDEQIEVVQNQIFELQYGKDDWRKNNRLNDQNNRLFLPCISLSSFAFKFCIIWNNFLFISSYCLFLKTNRGTFYVVLSLIFCKLYVLFKWTLILLLCCWCAGISGGF